MILEEIEKQARQEAKSYKTVYSEDFRFDEVMKDPLRFDQDYPKCLYLLLKEKHYRDGFQDGAKWGIANAIQWHDIESHVLPKREISKKYMPKANEKVMLKYHFYNETEIHYSDGYYDKFDFEFHIPNNPTGRIICVIAWCELPQFKE